MRIADLKKNDSANGPGVRVSLWVSGCTFACPGCHNLDIQDFNAGREWDDEAQVELFEALSNPYISGLSLLGGEPMQNSRGLIPVVDAVREAFPEHSIWCWSGYTFEQCLAVRSRRALLERCDVLVDGLFDQALYSPAIKWAGSSNQQVIDVKKSLDSGEVVLWEA